VAFSLVLQAASSANGGGEGRGMGAAGPFICVFPDTYTYFDHLMPCVRGKRREDIDGSVVVGPHLLSFSSPRRVFSHPLIDREQPQQGTRKWGRESFVSKIERERGERPQRRKEEVKKCYA